jgi:glycosyltransferase involved in cell wall biosynthesis
MKVIAIIPAFNEEATIKTVIQEIKQNEGIDIIVINDGSKDRTSALASDTGVTVIDFPKNKGIGKAMQAGYQYAVEHGYGIAIQVDADGQHDTKKLPELISKIRDDKYDMVIGSRYVVKTKYVSSFFRYLGIKYCSLIIFILHRIRIKDPTSGFRAVNRKIMQHYLMCYIDDYPEVPSLSYLLHHYYKICEIPVEMRKRQGGKSSISFADSFVYFIKVTCACIKGFINIRKAKKKGKQKNG